MRARFLHRGLEGHWRDAFQTALAWSHPNYPLMLPSTIARLWLYAGRESSVAPIIVAFLFEYSTMGVVVGALMAIGRRLEGLIAAAVLLANFPLNHWGVAQVADVPLSAFVVAATALLSGIVDQRDRLAGPTGALLTFCTGCAAWTKNEGLVFAVSICAVLALIVFVRRREIIPTLFFCLAGMLVPFATLLYFKGYLAPPSYLFEGFSGSTLPPQLWDLQRHAYILRSFRHELWAWTTTKPIGVIPIIVAYAVCATAVRGVRWAQLWIVVPLLVMLAGYYSAFVVTPLDLQWHLESSLGRLIVQVWPSIVYVAFCVPAKPLLADS
jgi:hypothetical protein